jgi:hypothetical protein
MSGGSYPASTRLPYKERVMTNIVMPGDEYTPGVAIAFAELLAAIAENLRHADGAGVVVMEGDADGLSVLLGLDTDLPIQVVSPR